MAKTNKDRKRTLLIFIKSPFFPVVHGSSKGPHPFHKILTEVAAKAGFERDGQGFPCSFVQSKGTPALGAASAEYLALPPGNVTDRQHERGFDDARATLKSPAPADFPIVITMISVGDGRPGKPQENTEEKNDSQR
jgi:hypothetical protein